MNVRDETRHDIHKICIVTRLISDIHFHITGQKLTINSQMKALSLRIKKLWLMLKKVNFKTQKYFTISINDQ